MEQSLPESGHSLFMRRALDLAALGAGSVSPNPMVGAVIVYEGKVVSEGWHRKFGGPHAEVEAIRALTDQSVLPFSTMYVTLEPCSHHGKTPPCADLLIEMGIKKVVVATEDPNPLVAGRGLKKLRDAGVEVITDILYQEAAILNKRFFTNIIKKRPYIILKWAQTEDGFLAPGLEATKEEKQISNLLSQQLVHEWRAREDAIMVGYNTLLYDNPQLNVRLTRTGRQPLRVTWDEKGSPQTNHYFFDGTQRSFIFTHHREEDLESHRYLYIEQGEQALAVLLSKLYAEGTGSVLVEGGRRLLERFLKADLWDEARICTARKRFSSGIKAPAVHLKSVERFQLDGDHWEIIQNPQALSAR